MRTDLRDALAAERTLLAWIRTGLALTGFGFVVARFGLYVQQLLLAQHVSALQPAGMSLWFGTALIAAGVFVNLLSAWHHVRSCAGSIAIAPVGRMPRRWLSRYPSSWPWWEWGW